MVYKNLYSVTHYTVFLLYRDEVYSLVIIKIKVAIDS